MLSASHDKIVYSGLIIVPALESREVVLVYDLPAETLVSEGDALVYTLTMQRQQGVRQSKLSLELVSPDGYSVESSSMPSTAGDHGLCSTFIVPTPDVTIPPTYSNYSSHSG